MKRLWCILLACVIPSCGGNSTGPEPTPQYPEPEPLPEPDPQIELSYENLAGDWFCPDLANHYWFGPQADISVRKRDIFSRVFLGQYFLNDPYIGFRGETTARNFSYLNPIEYTISEVKFYIATLTVIKTDSLQTPFPSSLGSDTLRSPYPDWITIKTRLDTILIFNYILDSNYRELFGLSDTTRDIEEQMLSLSTAEFSALLDSLKLKNVAGQPQLWFPWFRCRR